MGSSKRTAPESWGPWPPSQGHINIAVEKAARKLAENLVGDAWAQGAIFLAIPRSPHELDHFFHGTEEEICAGYVKAIGKHRSWMVLWNPTTGGGRLMLKSYDPHA